MLTKTEIQAANDLERAIISTEARNAQFEIARLTAELTASQERERVLREAVVEGLAVAVGCKGRIALTLFHVDRIRAALGEP